jgi:hypothetical protein
MSEDEETGWRIEGGAENDGQEIKTAAAATQEEDEEEQKKATSLKMDIFEQKLK